jgi:type II secretory pathway component PulF
VVNDSQGSGVMGDRPSHAKAILWALTIWIAHVVAMAVAAGALVVVVTSMLPVFENFDVDLPVATVMAIELADYCRHYWYTLLIPALLDAGLLLALAYAPPKLRWLAWLWSILWFLCAILFIAFTTSAVSLTVGQFVQRLSK